MKIALTIAAGLVAASSMAFAADNDGGKNNNQDRTTTGSIQNRDTGDIDDATKCREGTGGGAPCQEMGTEIQQ